MIRAFRPLFSRCSTERPLIERIPSLARGPLLVAIFFSVLVLSGCSGFDTSGADPNALERLDACLAISSSGAKESVSRLFEEAPDTTGDGVPDVTTILVYRALEMVCEQNP